MKLLPFEVGDGQEVTEQEWRDMVSGWAASGVIAGEYQEFSAEVGTGMNINVHPGAALLSGHYGYETVDTSIAVEAADATYDRIDLIVVRADLIVRTGAVAIKTGTPAATPVAPTPDTTKNVIWEVPLWEVYVPAGATSLAASNLTDRREYTHPARHGWTHGHDGGDPADADTVDRRHAYQMEGWDAYVDLNDTIPAGWVTIAEGDRSRVGWLEIVSSKYEYMRLLTGWEDGNQHNSMGAVLREWARVRYWRDDSTHAEYWTVRGVRIIYPHDDPIAGTAKLQVLWGGSGNVRIYQYTPTTADWVRYGNHQAWDFVTPVQEDPAGYDVAKTLYPGNGSWRLARALTGSGGTVGLQTPSQMQSLFPPDNPHGWNPASTMDGNTSTGTGGGVDDYYQSTNPVYVDQVIAKAYNTAAGTLCVYAKLQSGDAWESLGCDSTSGSGWATVNVHLSPTMYQRFKLDVSNGDGHVREFQISLAASLVLRGVPTGAAVQAVAADGTVLETVRNTSWTQDAPVMLVTDTSQIDTLKITRPDGSTNWLRYPTWAIDGGALANGDVLTLYDES